LFEAERQTVSWTPAHDYPKKHRWHFRANSRNAAGRHALADHWDANAVELDSRKLARYAVGTSSRE
jgi:hypothetical protein